MEKIVPASAVRQLTKLQLLGNMVKNNYINERRIIIKYNVNLFSALSYQ